jgi:hypothetical protein
MVLIIESGLPGRRAAAIASLSLFTAARRPAAVSVRFRSSLADAYLSMLLIAFPRYVTVGVRDEAVTFGYPRRRVARRVTASVSAYDPRHDVKNRRAGRVVEEPGS